MTERSSLGRATLTYGGAELGARAAWFAVVLALGCLLPQRAFGAWSLLIALSGLLEISLTLGLHGAAVRWVYDRNEVEYERVLFTLLVAWLAFSALAAGVLDQAGSRWFELLVDGLEWRTHGRLALGVAWLGAAGAIPLAMLVARGRAGRFAGLRLATVLGPIIGVLAVLGLGLRSPAAVFSGQLLGAAPLALLALGIGFGASTPRLAQRQLLPLLAFGLPVLPHMMAQWVLSWSDRWLLERLLDLESVAVYHLAYLPGLAVLLLGGALNRAWYPGFYRDLEALDQAETRPGCGPFSGAARKREQPRTSDGKRVLERLQRQSGAVLSCMAVGGATVALWGGELLALLPTDGYDQSPILVAPIAAGTTAALLYLLPHNLLYHHRKTGRIPLVTASAATLNLLLNLLLIPRMGALGAALATTVAYGALALAFWWVATRVSRLPLSGAPLLRAVGPAVAALAVALLLAVGDLPDMLRLGVEVATTSALAAVTIHSGTARELAELLGLR